MSKYNNNKKKNSIMKNIQRLRNEIEEIRIQNLNLMENLRPYEKWYEDAEEIIFSSRMRRKPKHHRSLALINRLSRDFNDIFSSLSSDSSDSESLPNRKTSQLNDDDDFYEIENLSGKNDDSNIQNRSMNTPKQKIDLNKLTQYLQKTGYKTPKQVFNTNKSATLHPFSITKQIQNNSSFERNTNYSMLPTRQNQEFNKPNNQPNINQTPNQIGNQYSMPAHPQLIQNNSQNQDLSTIKTNQYVYKTSPRSIPKVSQIGANSMLSNIVSQQKNVNINDANSKNPQKILNQVPLSNKLKNLPIKDHQTEDQKSDNSNATISGFNFTFGNNQANMIFNDYYKIDHNTNTTENNFGNQLKIISNKTINLDENNNDHEDTNTKINFDKSDIEAKESINLDDDKKQSEIDDFSSNLDDFQIGFLLEPPPIPEIKILNRRFGESSDNEDQITQNSDSDKKNIQQENQHTLLTPIFKFG